LAGVRLDFCYRGLNHPIGPRRRYLDAGHPPMTKRCVGQSYPALVLLLLTAAVPLSAHVGSPDVFFEGAAGPYRLLVTIRPPQVVPGIAEIEIRSLTPGIRQIRLLPLLLVTKNQFPPVPDLAEPSKDDSRFYT